MSAGVKPSSRLEVLVERSAYAPNNAIRLPILLGPLRGYGWSPDSGGKLARIYLGTYERQQTRLFVDLIRPGDVVFDLGAAAGYYTLLAGKLVGASGRVLACEPAAKNLAFLRQHVLANRLTHATVLPIALGGENGTARFRTGTGSGTGQLSSIGSSVVTVRRLDDLADEQRLWPSFIKLDVEGSELAVLQSGEETIRRYRPTIFLSTHNSKQPGVRTACLELLASWNYEFQPIEHGKGASLADWLCQAR